MGFDARPPIFHTMSYMTPLIFIQLFIILSITFFAIFPKEYIYYQTTILGNLLFFSFIFICFVHKEEVGYAASIAYILLHIWIQFSPNKVIEGFEDGEETIAHYSDDATVLSSSQMNSPHKKIRRHRKMIN